MNIINAAEQCGSSMGAKEIDNILRDIHADPTAMKTSLHDFVANFMYTIRPSHKCFRNNYKRKNTDDYIKVKHAMYH